MRKSLLLLAVGTMLTAGSVTAQNKALDVYSPSGYSGSKSRVLNMPYTATGLQWVADEYSDYNMQEDGAYTMGAWVNLQATQFSTTNETTWCPTKAGFVMGYISVGSGKHWRSDNTLWGIYYATNNKLYFHAQANEGGDIGAFNNSEIADFALQEWHHILVSIDNKNKHVAVYVDGQLAKESDIDNVIKLGGNNGMFSMGQIGVYRQYVDEVQFFKKALTPDEAAQAYNNAALVNGVASIYTLNSKVEGTLGTFENEIYGDVTDNAVFNHHKFNFYWDPNMLVEWQEMYEVEGTLVDGHDVSAVENVTFTVPEFQNGTVTITTGETNVEAGEHSVVPGTRYTVTATPDEGYALVSIILNTKAGERALESGSSFAVLGNTDIAIGFTNTFNVFSFTNELAIPFKIYRFGKEEYSSDSEENFRAIAGQPYRIVFDIPFDTEIPDITVGSEKVAVVNGAAEFTVAEGVNTLAVNAVKKATYNVTIVNPQINGAEAGTITVTGWDGEIANGGKAVIGDVLTIAYTGNEGYRFRHLTINGEGITGTTVVAESDLEISAAVAEGQEYPAMTHAYTNGLSQQNRYLKSMSQVGIAEPLFEAATQADLGCTFYPGPQGTYLPDGAIVNKTSIRAGHFQIDQATESFTLRFTPWKDPIILNGTTYNTEVGWTKFAVYVDWNNDGDFTDEGELCYTDVNSCSNTKYDNPDNCVATINVPGDANLQVGTYRLRFVLFEPEAADWSSKLFDNCQIRNGVAYDFDIDVATANYDEEREINIRPNNSEVGQVKFVNVPGAQEGDLSVNTAFKYIKVEATPLKESSFISWTNSNGDQLSTNNPYVYSGEESITMIANFGYAINAVAEGEGLVAISSKDNVYPSGSILPYGDAVTITPTAQEGYALKSLTVNDEEVALSEDGTYTFELLKETNVKAVFVERSYTVTWTVSGNGTLAVGATYDETTGEISDDIENGAEVSDDLADSGFYAVALPNKQTNGKLETVQSIIWTCGDKSTNPMDEGSFGTFKDDADGWFTPNNGIGFYLYGGMNDYVITVTFTTEGAAINGITLDAANGEVEYFNLQGVKVNAANMAPGFYIARQGNKAVKVMINK